MNIIVKSEILISTFELIEPNAFLEHANWAGPLREVAMFRVVQHRMYEIPNLANRKSSFTRNPSFFSIRKMRERERENGLRGSVCRPQCAWSRELEEVEKMKFQMESLQINEWIRERSKEREGTFGGMEEQTKLFGGGSTREHFFELRYQVGSPCRRQARLEALKLLNPFWGFIFSIFWCSPFYCLLLNFFGFFVMQKISFYFIFFWKILNSIYSLQSFPTSVMKINKK